MNNLESARELETRAKELKEKFQRFLQMLGDARESRSEKLAAAYQTVVVLLFGLSTRIGFLIVRAIADLEGSPLGEEIALAETELSDWEQFIDQLVGESGESA